MPREHVSRPLELCVVTVCRQTRFLSVEQSMISVLRGSLVVDSGSTGWTLSTNIIIS